MEFNNDEYPIIELDNSGQIIATNEKFKQCIFGSEVNSDQPVLKLIDDSIDTNTPLRAVLKFKGNEHACLLHLINSEDNRRTYVLSIIPTPASFEPKDLQDEVDSLKAANSGLMDFALVAAHDLNEPFRTIQNFLKLYKESIDHPLSEESQLYLEMIEMAAGRMRALLAGILEYYKANEPQKEPISINTLLDEIEHDLKLQIDFSKAEIVRKNILDVHADRNMTYLLFKNLISNAIKFKSKEESPKIEIDSTLVGGFIEYRIKDNGMGISEENLETIFNMFKRLNPKGEYEGAGIGLALCKNIVESAGGKIRVESAEQQGSTFIFTLPI